MKRTCRVCGCGDLDACVEFDGFPCAWVEPDLCSACVPAAVGSVPSSDAFRFGMSERLTSAQATRYWTGDW